MQHSKFLLLALVLGLPLALSGCYGILFSGATATGVAAAEDRSFGTVVDDNAINAEITHFYVQSNVNDLLPEVDIRVHEGRVLLTGKVAKQETAVEAVRLAWLAHGVKEVINEIEVTHPRSAMEYANDQWVETQIEARLLATKNIKSINYTVEVVDGVAYILGIALSEKELRDVTYIASRTRGVKKVESFVRIKDRPVNPA